MHISGIQRIHSSDPNRTDKPDWKRKSEIDKSDLFQRLLDSEMKKLESSKTDQSRMIPIQGK